MKQNYKALMLLSMLCAYGVLYSAATPDATLTAIATAATGLSNIPSEPMKTAYVKTHFSAAATSMAAICDMTTATFSSSQPSDLGVIFGIKNNTTDSFTVQQGSTNIATVVPGFNGDIPLHMTVLAPASGSSSSTSTFNFISNNSSAVSTLTVQVMTGTALATYLNAANTKLQGETSPESLLKNGTLPFSVTQLNGIMASDLFLVVANESASGETINPLLKRIQAINLSNFSNTVNPYIISLCINPIDYILNEDATTSLLSVATTSQPGTYTIGIESVKFLDALPAHAVPLLMLPRSIYLKGTAINALYSPYVNNYATTISQQNAVAISNNPNNVSTYGPYYDLAILATHEPYAKLHIFGYLNTDEALTAVVDQDGKQPSGTILGDVVFTDVYGAASDQTSSDLSWVSCNKGGIEQGKRYNFKVKFDTVAPSLETPKAEEFSATSLGFATWIANLSSSINYQNGVNVGLNPQPNGWIGVHTWQSTTGTNVFVDGDFWYQSFISLGNTGTVVAGQGYSEIGSLPCKFYELKAADWLYGVKMIPVFYDASKFKPFQKTAEFNAVNTSKQSALYFYLYNARTGKFLGLMPALAAGNGSVATYPTSTQYVQLFTGQWADFWSFKPTVATTPVTGKMITTSWNNATNSAIPGATAMVNGTNIPYPGYAEMVVPATGQGAAFAINKLTSISDLLATTEAAWKAEASKACFTANCSAAEAQAGLTLRIESFKQLGKLEATVNSFAKRGIAVKNSIKEAKNLHNLSDKYLATVTNASGSVIAFKVLSIPQTDKIVILETILSSGMTLQNTIQSQPLANGPLRIALSPSKNHLELKQPKVKTTNTKAPNLIRYKVHGGHPAMAHHPKAKSKTAIS